MHGPAAKTFSVDQASESRIQGKMPLAADSVCVTDTEDARNGCQQKQNCGESVLCLL